MSGEIELQLEGDRLAFTKKPDPLKAIAFLTGHCLQCILASLTCSMMHTNVAIPYAIDSSEHPFYHRRGRELFPAACLEHVAGNQSIKTLEQ